jgi:hypothetical protein
MVAHKSDSVGPQLSYTFTELILHVKNSSQDGVVALVVML